MSFLNDTPVEISTSILSYLPNVHLASACRVSRHVGAIATGLLYTAPILVTARHRGRSALDIFLRTLLMPDGDKLMVHVRSLTVPCLDFEHSTFIPTCPSDTELFAAAATRLGLASDVHGNKLTVLLCLLPYLTHIELAAPWDCQAFNMLLKSPHAPVLQHLRVFRHNPPPHHYDEFNGPIGVPEFLDLLLLPGLRSFDAHLRSSVMFATTTIASIQSGTSAITSLSFRTCWVSPSEVSPLLGLSKTLTHFHFAPETFAPVFDISTLSLEAVKHSLQHLHIDLSGVRQHALPSLASRRPLRSLRDYTALRTLRCSLQCLLGLDVRLVVPCLSELLPPRLTEFEVLEDKYWAGKFKVGKVLELLAEKERVPGMNILVMSVGRSRKALMKACEDERVKLVVRKAVLVTPTIRTRVQRCWRGRNNGSGVM